VAKLLFKNKDTTAISVIYSDEYGEKQDVFWGEDNILLSNIPVYWEYGR